MPKDHQGYMYLLQDYSLPKARLCILHLGSSYQVQRQQAVKPHTARFCPSDYKLTSSVIDDEDLGWLGTTRGLPPTSQGRHVLQDCQIAH